MEGILGYFFGIFHLRAPSFNHYEEDIRGKATKTARKVFRKLFAWFDTKKSGDDLPCSNQVRSVVDRVDPNELKGTFSAVWQLIQRSGLYPQLQTIVGKGKNKLNLGLHVLVDGVETFCSKCLSCQCCCHRTRNRGKENETTDNYHQQLVAVVNVPTSKKKEERGEKFILPLDVEPMIKEDGETKNGSERRSNKRLIENIAAKHKNTLITVTADDIHNDTPTLKLLKSKNMHWLMTCKPDSHEASYDALRGAEKLGSAKKHISQTYQHKIRNKNGSYDIYQCQSYFTWAKVPSKWGEGAIDFNLVEERIIDIETGQKLVERGFSTDHAVIKENVYDLRNVWRKQWRLENNGNNELKNHGANLEHNYGHGEKNLETNRVTLTWLSLLIINILLWIGEDGFFNWRKGYQALSKAIYKLREGIIEWKCTRQVESWKDLYDILLRPP